MKRLIVFLLVSIMVFSMVACGNETATPTASPEINVEDTYYTKVLANCPVVLIESIRENTHILIGDNGLHLSSLLSKEDFEDNCFAEEFGKMTFEEYSSILNAKGFKPIPDEETYMANPDAYKIPESMQNRYDWEVKNNFYFENFTKYYLSNIEGWDNYTPNGLAVIFYYGDKIAEKRFQNQYLNPYFNEEEFEALKAKDVPKLNGIYNYDTACKNLETEKAKLVDTVTKYLEQKYKGVDNGIEFSDYMLNYTTFKEVQKFINSQKLKDVEIAVNATYANLLSFHPFVDIEYTLTANGEEKVIHEVYFLEIDKADNGEFVFKIAYVADYGEDSKFSYTKFREGEFAVGESFDWDPLKDICVTNNSMGLKRLDGGIDGRKMSAYGLAEMY